MPPALKVRASGANGTRPPAEPLHPVLPNATENPDYSRFAKHKNMYLDILPDITEMCYSRYSCTWPSSGNFGLCSRRCLDLLWFG